MSCRSFFRKVSNIFLVAGAILLLGWGVVQTQAHVYRAYETHRLNSQLRAVPPAPQNHPAIKIVDARPPAEGSVLGMLEIPRIGIDTVVLEGDDARTLRLAAGHIPGTTMLVDSVGNIGIAAHRDTLFRPLRHIRANDVIILKTFGGTRRYLVKSIRIVRPTDVSVLNNTGRRMLTLVTCYPFYFVGSAPLRFIVQATEL